MCRDGSPLVCSDPPIWVFDGLLSEKLLDHVDASFEGLEWRSMNGREVRILEHEVDEVTAELPRTLCEISHIDEISPCQKVWIMDVQGRDQGAHMDGWEVAKSREAMKQLDLSKCSVQNHQGFSTIIPTLSFVIYFNDVGGCTFPKAAMEQASIPAKRGRILMFQNYKDADRPAHNPAAVHFGVYGASPKRVMTAGVMSSETPVGLQSSPFGGPSKTKGFLYAPIMHRSNTSCGSDTYSPPPPPKPPPKPKTVLQLQPRPADEGGFIVEASNLAGDVQAKALVEFTDLVADLRRSLAVDAQLLVNGEVMNAPGDTRLVDTPLFEMLVGKRSAKACFKFTPHSAAQIACGRCKFLKTQHKTPEVIRTSQFAWTEKGVEAITTQKTWDVFGSPTLGFGVDLEVENDLLEDGELQSMMDSEWLIRLPKPTTVFTQGDEVEVHSLSKSELNGMRGEAIAGQLDRIVVLFPDESAKAIKPANLKNITEDAAASCMGLCSPAKPQHNDWDVIDTVFEKRRPERRVTVAGADENEVDEQPKQVEPKRAPRRAAALPERLPSTKHEVVD
eukprot:TRINITY_DN27260_c0_g1_i1.p1 TRINITY_DN27260_c0_g1~~TRINITY_DN27260_c0_g1_i1.p1  ORF type:complete len:561 (-),score=95.99 TRINITY_DN27260_c0_g1_i1:272-1954(-)